MFDNKRKIFTQIYDDHIEKIYRFIFLKVNSQDVAQDLCSETFVRAWKSFNSEDRQIDNPQAFLYQIARNLVIDHYREKGKVQMVQIENIPVIDDRTDLEKESHQRSDLEAIQAVLANIRPEYQEIVTYHYINDLTVSEIAKIMNKTENNVRVTLHRALNDIRGKIRES
ncbi:RNA polymerase sigma factor [Patescibacteria group bacterium]|nr:RNA polymerase sigma factor [Patescibacteria group bacterium]